MDTTYDIVIVHKDGRTVEHIGLTAKEAEEVLLLAVPAMWDLKSLSVKRREE